MQNAAVQSYVLGHAEPELERLERQGRFLEPLTRDVLVRAGIGPGMRVLDFGAGAGDVSLLLARLVGREGRVIAIDRAPEAVARARARFAALGVANVEVRTGDETLAHELAGDAGFDAVVGRLVLLHQREPEDTLARLVRTLRPGGIAAFHEIEIEAGCWSSPRLPLLELTYRLIVDTFVCGGMVTDIGTRIRRGFERAGVRDVHVMREGRVEAGRDSGAYEYLVRVLRTLLPALERLRIASAAALDLDTLEQRLRDEATAAGARFVPVFFASAWARTPVRT